jgi:hypothetical protein
VSEWFGRFGRLRRTVYARMEELSFRSGASAVAGVLAVAATAVVLTLTQSGHSASAQRVQEAGPSIAAFPTSLWSTSAPSPDRHPRTHSATTTGPAPNFAPESAQTPTATPQAPAQPTSRRSIGPHRWRIGPLPTASLTLPPWVTESAEPSPPQYGNWSP